MDNRGATTVILATPPTRIARFLRAHADVMVLGLCSNGEEALDMIALEKPEFAIVSEYMPKLTGLQVVRRARQAQLTTRFIVASCNRDESTIKEFLRSGCHGYVLEKERPERLFDAFDSIRAGKQYITPSLDGEWIERRNDSDPVTHLSKREYEIFTLLVDGVRPIDIARSLEISPKTVDTHRAKLMRKLSIHSVAGLVRFAIRRDLAVSYSEFRRPDVTR